MIATPVRHQAAVTRLVLKPATQPAIYLQLIVDVTGPQLLCPQSLGQLVGPAQSLRHTAETTA